MAFRKARDFTPVLTTRYENTFPTLDDLTRQGGIPGVTYYLCHAGYAAAYQSQGAELVAGLPMLEIVGPKGTASATLMCSGDPIPGASPMNGIRRYLIDPLLREATGITEDTHGKAQEDREGAAGVQSGDAPQRVGSEGDEPQAGGGNRAQRAAGSRPPAQHA